MTIRPETMRVMLATQPVDFRKGMEGLAAHIANTFNLDPFCGAIFVFRSKSAKKLKLLVWDGTGLVLTTKRLDGGKFVWPKPQAVPQALSRVQFEALFEGIDWTRVGTTTVRKPIFL